MKILDGLQHKALCWTWLKKLPVFQSLNRNFFNADGYLDYQEISSPQRTNVWKNARTTNSRKSLHCFSPSRLPEQNATAWVTYTIKVYFICSQVWMLELEFLHGWVLLRALFLACWRLPSCHVFTWWRESPFITFSYPCFYHFLRAPVLSDQGFTLMTSLILNHLLKGPSPGYLSGSVG